MASQRYGIEVVTAATEEPVTLAELRAHLRISTETDNTELENIWIPAARAEVEKSSGLKLLTQTLRMYLDGFPADPEFEIPVGPVTSVTSVKYLDADGVEQTLSASAYTVDVRRKVSRVCLNPGYSWPGTKAVPNAVRVLFVAGYSSRANVPQLLRGAVLLAARAYYDGETELPKTVARLIDLEWSGSLDAKT